MPYLNEHAARILNPINFIKDSFKRKNIATGIDIILGKLKTSGKFVTQTYRFNKNIFSPIQAQTWLKAHKIHYISFEKAK